MTFIPPSGLGDFFPQAYGAITDGGDFGDGAAHPASSNGYATLAALQAVYSFATALTNDMAGLMIQKAINAAHAAGGGTIPLPSGSFHNLPTGLIFPAYTNAYLTGVGAPSVILCSNCGTNPGVTINASAGRAPIGNLKLQGLDTVVGISETNYGTAQTNMFNAGSRGMWMTGNNNVTYTGLVFYNFDIAHDWDTSIGNNYIITFKDGIYGGCNKGVSIPIGCPNSFEKMIWDNCVLAGCNYGAYINFTTNATVGSGYGVAAEAYLINCSIDYNIVCGVYYMGGASNNNDAVNSVYMAACYMETNSQTSGTSARIQHEGCLYMTDVECFESGYSYPIGMVQPIGYYALTSITNCKAPGYNNDTSSTATPMIYTSGSYISAWVTNLRSRINYNTIAIRTYNGDVSGYTGAPDNYFFGSNFTLALPMAVAPAGVYITANCTITVPASTTCNFLIGSVIRFTTLPSFTGTFAAASGVTITTVGAGLTFGGSTSKEVFLKKVATNTWLATGQMT